MPYEINWETNGVLVRFSGTFDLEQNNNATIDLLDAPQFESLKYMIWDLSDISEQNMTEEEARLVAMQDQLVVLRLLQVRMAILAQDERTRSICRTYVAHLQGRLTGWDFMVSESLESIRTWATS